MSLTVTGPSNTDTKTVPNMIAVNVAPGAPAAPFLQPPVPGRGGTNNTFTVTGVAANASVFLIGSPNLGSSSLSQSGCSFVTGLLGPRVLSSTRANGTTATFRISLNSSLIGTTFRTQALEIGRCAVSNVDSHVY